MAERFEPGISLLWAHQQRSVFSALSLNTLREICAYLPPPYHLALVFNSSLSYFDCSTQTMRPAVTLDREFDSTNSRWVAVDTNRVVLCGGGDGNEAWKTAYMLYANGSTLALPDMLHGHRSCGLTLWCRSIYVFGSFVSEGATKSECFSLREQFWSSLPDMQTNRSCFTPVVWQSAVYLCGGNQNNTVEVWDGHCMTLLDFLLPVKGNTVGCVQRDEMLLVNGDTLLVLSKPQGSRPPVVVTRQAFPNLLASSPSPILYQGTIFHLYGQELKKFSVNFR